MHSKAEDFSERIRNCDLNPEVHPRVEKVSGVSVGCPHKGYFPAYKLKNITYTEPST